MKSTYNAVDLFKFISQEAAACSPNWSLRNQLRFHYFNPHGLLAAKRALDDRIRNLVDAGHIPSGWHIAHGTFDTYCENRLQLLYDRKRVGRIDVQVCLRMLVDRNARVEKLVAAEEAKRRSLYTGRSNMSNQGAREDLDHA